MKSNQPSETYKRLHCDIIEALIEQICDHYENYCMRYLTGNEKTAIVMWRKFEEYRKKSSSNMSSSRLDRHKLASCICGTIIEVQPLEGKKDAEIKNVANEILGLYTGLSVVKMFMIDDLAEKYGIPPEKDSAMVNYMYRNFDMKLPSLDENICDVQEYKQNLINALYWSHSKCSILNRECYQRYDVWAYAKIFYHLEVYNKKHFDEAYEKYKESQR